MKLTGVILSAGESKRMGCIKALERLNGKTFIEHAIDSLKDVVSDLVVVLGRYTEDIKGAINTNGFNIIINNDYKQGQTSSLKCAIKYIKEKHSVLPDGIVLSLIDHPGISKQLVKKLSEVFAKKNKIIVPAYNGRRGHPTIFPKYVFDEILNLPFSKGANEILRNHLEIVEEVATDESAILKNINTK